MNNTVIKQDFTLVMMINDEKLMLISSLHQKLWITQIDKIMQGFV